MWKTCIKVLDKFVFVNENNIQEYIHFVLHLLCELLTDGHMYHYQTIRSPYLLRNVPLYPVFLSFDVVPVFLFFDIVSNPRRRESLAFCWGANLTPSFVVSSSMLILVLWSMLPNADYPFCCRHSMSNVVLLLLLIFLAGVTGHWTEVEALISLKKYTSVEFSYTLWFYVIL